MYSSLKGTCAPSLPDHCTGQRLPQRPAKRTATGQDRVTVDSQFSLIRRGDIKTSNSGKVEPRPRRWLERKFEFGGRHHLPPPCSSKQELKATPIKPGHGAESTLSRPYPPPAPSPPPPEGKVHMATIEHLPLHSQPPPSVVESSP